VNFSSRFVTCVDPTESTAWYGGATASARRKWRLIDAWSGWTRDSTASRVDIISGGRFTLRPGFLVLTEATR
jgi:hypothetical protein